MSFVNEFFQSFATSVKELADWLQEEHNIPLTSTLEKWNTITNMNIVLGEDSNVNCPDFGNKKIDVQRKNTPNHRVIKENTNTCKHVFVSGIRKGTQCTTKPSREKDRCGAHKIKVKNNQKKPKKINSSSSSDDDTLNKEATNKIISSDDDTLAKKNISSSDSSDDDTLAKKNISSSDDSSDDDTLAKKPTKKPTKKPKVLAKKATKVSIPVSEVEESDILDSDEY